jgi:hypothetical protein
MTLKHISKPLKSSKKTIKKGSKSTEVKTHVEIDKNTEDGKEVIKEKGRALEVADRVQPQTVLKEDTTLVGLSKGTTINMGNYQSARIDCWVVRACRNDEDTVMKNLGDMSLLIDDQINYESEALKMDDEDSDKDED